MDALPLRTYQDWIIASLRCTAREAVAVEGLMRSHLAQTKHVYGLDVLPGYAFDGLARDCFETLGQLIAKDGGGVEDAISRYFLD